MADPARKYAPLTSEELEAGSEMGGAPASAWVPVLPAPLDAPRTPPPHRLGKPSASWTYRDAAGNLLGLACRFDYEKDGQPRKDVLPLTFCRNTATGKTAWRWQSFPQPRPLFGLDRLAARPEGPVLIVEGEKVCEAAERLFPGYVAVTSPGGGNAAGKSDWWPLRGRHVTIWPDRDAPGDAYAADVARLATRAGAASVRVVQVPADWPEGWDLADELPCGITINDLKNLLEVAVPFDTSPASAANSTETAGLRLLNIGELLKLDLPPRRHLLKPWLPEQGLAMIYAKRGVGKTWFALSVAYAVASGGTFLNFTAAKPRRVLYIDGEMPLAVLQQRLASIVATADHEPPDQSYLRILAADAQEVGLPDLSTAEGQAMIEPLLDGIDLIIIDNLSTLVRNGQENEAVSWQPVQDWALAQRRAGRSVVFIHHAGKGGNQRGTSKREDVLDTVISLRHPADYTADQGARFEVHFEKARGLAGEEAMPFEARCEANDGNATWTVSSITDAEMQRVIDLKAEGLSVRDIAEETGFSKSKVQRLIDRARMEGMLDADE